MTGWRGTLLGGIVVAVLFGAMFGWGLDLHPLLDADEARHSEVAREMTVGVGVARFFLPTFDWEPYREKPPGYYWLVSAAYALAGVGSGAARAVNAFGAWLSLLAIYVYAARREGATAGLAAASVTGTCLGFLGLARYGNLDMALSTCVTLGVLSGLAWLDAPSPRRPLWGPFVAAAAGLMVKGPIAAALVFGPLVLAAWLRRGTFGWREIRVGRGIGTFAMLVGGVLGAITFFDPLYVSTLYQTNVVRFAPDAPHAEPAYYYALWLPVLVMPWTVLAVPALLRAARRSEDRPLLAWFVFVLVLFSVPRGKLATYVLPALAPFGLLVGSALARAASTPDDQEEETDDDWLRSGAWGHLVLVIVLMAAAVVAAITITPPRSTAVFAVVMAWWALVTIVVLRREAFGVVPTLIVATTLTAAPIGLVAAAPVVGQRYSDATAALLGKRMGVTTVIAFRSRSPSLVFYAAPTAVVHVDRPKQVRELFESGQAVMLVTGERHAALLERSLGALAHRWLATGRRRTYGNRPLPMRFE